jgi:hypothetical protein
LRCKKVLDGNVVALRACLLKYKEFDPSQNSSRLAATYENIKETARELAILEERRHARIGKATEKELARRMAACTISSRAEMYEENLKHEAIGGLMVRSKSEALIAFALDLAHIPFHYEEILEIG